MMCTIIESVGVGGYEWEFVLGVDILLSYIISLSLSLSLSLSISLSLVLSLFYFLFFTVGVNFLPTARPF